MGSLYMSILILGFISGVSMVTCPKEGDIYPCTCEDHDGRMITVTCLRGNFIKSYPLKILQLALSSLNGKTDIDLRFDKCNISIPSNFFAGIGIQFLRFQSCRIDSLGKDDQMLTGLENHLQVLDISNSSIVQPKLNLGHLKELRTVDWSGNNVTELTDDWFSYSYSLKILSVRRNNITKIGNYAFYHLTDLFALTLENNRFGPLKRSMFPRRGTKLTYLALENNAITDLPVDLFSGMPHMFYVYLSRNGITTLDERTWSPIWQQLRTVELDDNNIVCDDRLNWISKSEKNPRDISISGQCSAPKEFKGRDLYKFFRSQRHNQLLDINLQLL